MRCSRCCSICPAPRSGSRSAARCWRWMRASPRPAGSASSATPFAAPRLWSPGRSNPSPSPHILSGRPRPRTLHRVHHPGSLTPPKRRDSTALSQRVQSARRALGGRRLACPRGRYPGGGGARLSCPARDAARLARRKEEPEVADRNLGQTRGHSGDSQSEEKWGLMYAPRRSRPAQAKRSPSTWNSPKRPPGLPSHG